MDMKPLRDPSSQSSPLSRRDYYNVVNTQINHQDNLVNQRVIWLVVSEAFFFIAYVTLLNAPETQNARQVHERNLMYWLVPIAGLLAGVFSYIAVLASMAHIGQLNQLFQHYFNTTSNDDNSADDMPPIQGTRAIRHVSKITPICLPLVFIVTWVFILVW